MSNTKSIPMVTFRGFLDCQVCVPKDFTDPEAEEFANSVNPTGIESTWTIKLESDPTMIGAKQRIQCLERADCVHIMLSC